MAAAAEFATAFLEISLGTHLVVSFPASATTVADLKRQVTAEHAACFPETGPIAVKSLKVTHNGSLFHLADSMLVEGAFRWVQGPWNILVEARELGSHPLPREDPDCRNGGGSEQNSDNPVISHSAQNTSAPVVSRGGDNLAIGHGVSGTPLLNQLDENHQVVECAPYQLEDENTVPQESSGDLYLAAGGSGAPSMDQLDQSRQGVTKHAMSQQTDEIVKTMVQECSDLCLAASGSDKAVDLQDESCEVVKQDLGQPDDGAEKTMLEESSDLDVEAGESDSREKNMLEDANVKTMLQGSSSLDAAAGEGDTPSMNHQDKSYKGVKDASGRHRKGNVNAMVQENSHLDVAGGEVETSLMNQQNKSYGSVKHASGQCEDGDVMTMPEKSSDFGVAANERETPPMNQLDKSHEGVRSASGQLEDGTVNIMLPKSSDLDESATAKDNGRMWDHKQDVIAEPRETELFQKEDKNDENIIKDKNDENIIGNCNGNISSLASSIVNINLAEEKSMRFEPENLNTDPMAYNQGNCSHDAGENPSRDEKEPWTSEVCSGEASNSASDIPPCVHSMNRDNSSNREVNARNDDEPWVAGLCSGESSFKQTDVPHYIESMKEGNKRQTYNDRLKKRKHEGTEHQSCSQRRPQRVLVVRKVPMSKAAKIFGIRC